MTQTDHAYGVERETWLRGAAAHPLGSLAIAGWISSRRAYAPGVTDVLGNDSRTLRLPVGVFLAVGEPRYDLIGFRRTHLDAGHARRVASVVARHRETVTRYRDVAVLALCTADSDHALAFATRILGPLAAGDEATFRLARTLEAYLHENRSRTRAAARLAVHPNTVSYRVHQAEERLGRGVDADTLDLRVALTLLPTLRRLEQAR